MSLTKEQLENKLTAAEAERDDYKSKYEAADTARSAAEAERDDYKSKYEAAGSTAPATAAAQPSEEDTIKDVLRRNGLKVAYMLASGPCFSEAHAREYAGADFDSLTVISVEEDAGTN